MFLQACVTSTPGGGGREEWTRDMVTTPPSLPPGPGHNTSLPLPPGLGHNTSLPPRPGHNTSLPPPDLVTTPPSPLPGTWSQHLPPSPQTWSQHLPPSPPDLVTTPPSLAPPPGPGHNTSPRPPGLCTGGWYASYWNAFLLLIKHHNGKLE